MSNTKRHSRRDSGGLPDYAKHLQYGGQQHPVFSGLRSALMAFFSFNGWHSEAHVPGRHLNALLNAEGRYQGRTRRCGRGASPTGQPSFPTAALFHCR